jgi:hypothetical protein
VLIVRDNEVDLVAGLWATRSRVWFPEFGRDFCLLNNFIPALGLSIFLGSRRRDVKLPTQLQQMPRLRMDEINTSAFPLCFHDVQRELLRCS